MSAKRSTGLTTLCASRSCFAPPRGAHARGSRQTAPVAGRNGQEPAGARPPAIEGAPGAPRAGPRSRTGYRRPSSRVEFVHVPARAGRGHNSGRVRGYDRCGRVHELDRLAAGPGAQGHGVSEAQGRYGKPHRRRSGVVAWRCHGPTVRTAASTARGSIAPGHGDSSLKCRRSPQSEHYEKAGAAVKLAAQGRVVDARRPASRQGDRDHPRSGR